MAEFPDGKIPDAGVPAGSVTRVLRIALKAMGYILLGGAAAAAAGYIYVMRPAFLEPLIIEQFARKTHGKIEIKIEQASLFRGFKFANVVIHPPAGFKETPILKAREISLLYNVFGFFRGKFGVHEIALKDTEVFIEQKKNILNVQALAKPSEKKAPEKEKEEEPEDKESSPIISWFFDIQVFARFALENFNFTFDALDASNARRQYAHLKNFTFRLSLLTRDFSKIDKKDIPGAIALLNAFVIELNPQKTVDIAFQAPAATVVSKLDLFWRLFYDGQSKTPEFISQMHLGQEKFPVALGRRPQQNLPFLIDHRIEYNAKEDRLKIENFQVSFLGDTLLALSGGGEKLLSQNRSFDLQTGNSKVNLGKLYEVTSQLSGKKDPVYSGTFSIKPTKVAVRGQTIDDQGGLKLSGVVVRSGRFNISIPTLDLDHAAAIDQARKPLPVKTAQINLRGVINGAGLGFDAGIAENKKTAVNFYLRGFDISPFAEGKALGLISTTFSAAGDSPQNLALHLRVFSPQLFYFVDRGKSGVNRIDFNVKGTAKSSEDFKQNSVHLSTIAFSNKDKEYGSAVDLKSHLTFEKAQTMKIQYGLQALTISIKELLNTLPSALQEQYGALAKFVDVGRTLRADGETNIDIAGSEQTISHATHVAIPDINVDDIDIKAETRISPPMTYIDQFTITGLRKALRISADGSLKDGFETVRDEKTGKNLRVAGKVPNLKFSAELARKEESEILDDTFLVGLFSLTGTAKSNIVSGLIKIDNLSFRNNHARVNKVNMDFPFKHDLKLKKTLNLRAGNKERIIKNYNFNKAYNFTIQDIEIPDPNNKKEWLQLIYSRGSYPAVGASLEYKDNVFVMPVMQMYTLNGVVTISDTLFNVGRLRPSEMEYSSTIQIKDIDLKPLMVKEKADTITDGKLRIDMLFTGNRLDKPVENLSGYLSVFRIGPEFAQMVMRASSPKQSNLISNIASSAAKPERIDIDIKEGFIYTHIPMTAGLLGRLTISPEEINNRRINIPEFFQRISNEASIYAAPQGQAN